MGRKALLPLKIARVNLWSNVIFWGKNIYHLKMIIKQINMKNAIFHLADFFVKNGQKTAFLSLPWAERIKFWGKNGQFWGKIHGQKGMKFVSSMGRKGDFLTVFFGELRGF
jgi:hypothetical protein